MARILYSDGVSAVAGRVRGTTFQRTGAGECAETTRWLTNHRKLVEQKRRQRFRYVTSSWRDLTSSEQSEWNEAAPPGQSGFHFFMSENIQTEDYYQPIKRTPPPPPIVGHIDFQEEKIVYSTGGSKWVESGIIHGDFNMQALNPFFLILIDVTNSPSGIPSLSNAVSPNLVTSGYINPFEYFFNAFDQSYPGQPPFVVGNKAGYWAQAFDHQGGTPITDMIFSEIVLTII